MNTNNESLLKNPQEDYLALIENPPKDLYIPPDALEVFLEAFSGPLDLLLYLIKRQNIDILNIPIAQITRQYMAYMELMQRLKLDLAAEYLVMAATLAHIKSRLLLPNPTLEDEEEDPRAALIRQLQEYEQFKRAADALDTLPRKNRDFYTASAFFDEKSLEESRPELDLKALVFALSEIMKRVKHQSHHQIQREHLSIRERMTHIIATLHQSEFTAFEQFFNPEEGKQGVVVTFMAILELIRESIIEVAQSQPFATLYVKKR